MRRRTTRPKTKEKRVQMWKSRWKLLRTSKRSERRIEQEVVIAMKEEFSIQSLNSYFCAPSLLCKPHQRDLLHPSGMPSKVHTDVFEEPPPRSHPL
jgi:hypothetical protein